MLDEESYSKELHNRLSYQKSIYLIDDFISMTKSLSKRFSQNILPMINFSGGDPLLHGDFFKILNYANSKGIKIGILGNPTYINPSSAKQLKDNGVTKYQISLDGLEGTHDKLRKKGSFEQSIKALSCLQKENIVTHVMFSLSKLNKDDLIPLMELMIKKEIDKFIFTRVSFVGNAKKIHSKMQALEYRELLLKIHNIYQSYANQGIKTKLGYKDHLWLLLHKELGLFKPNGSSNKIYGGCGIGINFLVVLADGTVYACRRFPSPVGKVPDEKLYDIFLNSERLNYYRQYNNFELCKNCELLNYCRGCPAVSYGESYNYFAPDPQCWKECYNKTQQNVYKLEF